MAVARRVRCAELVRALVPIKVTPTCINPSGITKASPSGRFHCVTPVKVSGQVSAMCACVFVNNSL